MKGPSLLALVQFVVLIIVIGCSHGGASESPDPLTPHLSASDSSARDSGACTRHALLGLYTFIVDPDTPAIETVPLRDAMFHLNALSFLEPPPPVRIILSNFEYDGVTIDVDIEFVHPFEGLTQYTGFDVCGTLISSGSISGFSDPDLVIAGDGDTRLMNPDGLTRWWNPREFPFNEEFPMWGYIDGVKGTPDSQANFSATLNGYKYHADGLGIHDDLTALDPSMRGAFSAGSVNARHYRIRLDAGLVFNYAIDASYLPPDIHPIVVPDSFPEGANREEPYMISITVSDNTLFFNSSTGSGGGELGLDIHCYDWFNADQNTVRVESPGVFDPVTSGIPTGGTDVYSTYHIDIIDSELESADPIDFWISAEAGMGYDGFLPGRPVATYLPSIEVEVELQNPTMKLIWRDEAVIEHPFRTLYNDIEPALIRDFDGDVHLTFFYWEPGYTTYPLYSSSTDQGHSFSEATHGYWETHNNGSPVVGYNMKYTLGSDGQPFHSYDGPDGHTVGKAPWDGTYPDPTGGSHSGPIIDNAGEMLFTVEGYPMMIGDLGGTIIMRRGDFPNEAGTGSWPLYQGTEYVLVAEGLLNFISVARSTGKTSDGFCHLIFWHPGHTYIRMVSSTDITGTDWTYAYPVFEGLAEIWVGASDPSLWIDDHDSFHTLFAGEIWWGEFQLVYGYSADGTDWDEMSSFEYLEAVPVEDGLNDTQVVLFDAFDETWIFLCYETAGNVWCKYRKITDESFSDPIQVNVHFPAALPDIYPNGDTGVVFAYQASDDSGSDQTDIYYRLAEFVEE